MNFGQYARNHRCLYILGGDQSQSLANYSLQTPKQINISEDMGLARDPRTSTSARVVLFGV